MVINVASHIGETVRIADTYTRGLINDHVSAQWASGLEPETKIYNVYARRDYNVRKGPEPIPKGEREGYYMSKKDLELGEKPRGWGPIDTICEKVTLDEAMKLAEPEAQKRGVVLYLNDISETTIKWHPDGWQPREG